MLQTKAMVKLASLLMSHAGLIAIAKKRPMPSMMTSRSTARDRTFKTPRFLISNAQSHHNLRRSLETLIMSKQSKPIAMRPSLKSSRQKKPYRLSLEPTRSSGQKTSWSLKMVNTLRTNKNLPWISSTLRPKRCWCRMGLLIKSDSSTSPIWQNCLIKLSERTPMAHVSLISKALI